MTASSAKWLTALEWARIASLLGLAPTASPEDMIATLEARSDTKTATNAAHEARWAAIRACQRCDPTGWQLDSAGLLVEPVIRCDHGASAHRPPGRDFSSPTHESRTQ